MNINGNSIFITGGGSGIGLALARAFLAEGNRVVVCGRDPERLAAAQRTLPDLQTVLCDITDEEDVRRAVAEFADTTILVNNAGIARVHDFRNGEPALASMEQEIETNLVGTVRATTLFLPQLLRQPAAAIVTISSALAHVPAPALPIYSATRAAVHAFATALRYQLRGTQVKVVDVLPPWVDTELSRGLGASKITPETVARAVVNGLRTDTEQIYVGRARTLYTLSRIAPTRALKVVAGMS